MYFKNNRVTKSFLLILLAAIFASVLSFIPGDTKIFGFGIKKIDFISDIRNTELESTSFKDMKFSKHPNYAMINPSELSKLSSDFMGREFSKIYQPNSTFEMIDLSGNLSNLSHFFQALKSSSSRKVRIAHFGDSAIEGDLITATIRNILQKQFGGVGVGFLSVTSQDVSFRTTTKHSFSSDWKTGSIILGNSNKWLVGMSGSVSSPASNSWIKYETMHLYNKPFSNARLIYTDSKGGTIKYSTNNGAENTANLTAGAGVKELSLSLPTDTKNLKLTFPTADQGKFFGVSLESGNGVYVDNFPLRGNSGVSIKDIPLDALKGFNRIFDYKLIVLSFGLNMTTSGTSDFSWYEREMIKVVEHLKSAFPQTSIIIVGVGDRSTKQGTNFVTDPGIPKLIKAQKNVASTTGIVFWNLFEAMGGQNSMPKWVNSNPPLAMKDYTHNTLQGAEKIAKLFTDALLEQFKK